MLCYATLCDAQALANREGWVYECKIIWQALANREGILTGISGGGSMWAALETAKKAPQQSMA
jgi:hypothetical protein